MMSALAAHAAADLVARSPLAAPTRRPEARV
jgi:hypothetical protein